jgi:hypothetical protein
MWNGRVSKVQFARKGEKLRRPGCVYLAQREISRTYCALERMHKAQELGLFRSPSPLSSLARASELRLGGSHVGTPMKAYEGTPASMVLKDTIRLPAGDPVKMASVIVYRV